MKNCICCLMMSSILYGSFSCGEQSPVAGTLPEEKTLNRATRLPSEVILDDTDKNVVVKAKAATANRFEPSDQEAIIASVNALKGKYERSNNIEGDYLDDVPLNAFLGQKVEFGTLEVNTIGNDLIRIYADYFDGEPVGSKLFWVEKGNLVAIEIIELTKKVTEQGIQIEDNLRYVCYYNNNQLIKIIDDQKKSAKKSQDITWVDENMADWDVVQQYLNVF